MSNTLYNKFGYEGAKTLEPLQKTQTELAQEVHHLVLCKQGKTCDFTSSVGSRINYTKYKNKGTAQ